MENQEYKKHKESFSSVFTLSSITSISFSLAILLFLFLPIFKSDYEILLVKYSLFDEIVINVKSAFTSTGSQQMVSILVGLFMLISGVCIILSAIFNIVRAVRDLGGLGNLDTFAENKYKDFVEYIKTKGRGGKKPLLAKMIEQAKYYGFIGMLLPFSIVIAIKKQIAGYFANLVGVYETFIVFAVVMGITLILDTIAEIKRGQIRKEIKKDLNKIENQI